MKQGSKRGRKEKEKKETHIVGEEQGNDLSARLSVAFVVVLKEGHKEEPNVDNGGFHCLRLLCHDEVLL